jgi:hypothetical protein
MRRTTGIAAVSGSTRLSHSRMPNLSRGAARSPTSSIEVPRRLLGACSLPPGWETGDGSSRPSPSPVRPSSLCGLGCPDHYGSHRRQPLQPGRSGRRSGTGHWRTAATRWARMDEQVWVRPLGLGDRPAGPRQTTANPVAERVGTYPAIDIQEGMQATARRCRQTGEHPGRGVVRRPGHPPSMARRTRKSAPGPSGVTPEWDPAQADQALTPAGRPPPSHGRCRSRAR